MHFIGAPADTDDADGNVLLMLHFMDSWVHGCMDSWIRVCADISSVEELLDFIGAPGESNDTDDTDGNLVLML